MGAICYYGSTHNLISPPGLGPLYGRMSEVVGRKPVLFFGIAMFLLGSALCAVAKTFIWLVIGMSLCMIRCVDIRTNNYTARGVQGVGCGGITTLDIIILSDISVFLHIEPCHRTNAPHQHLSRSADTTQRGTVECMFTAIYTFS